MNREFRMQYLETVYERYRKASKSSKTRILNELCQNCSYNRKYVIWRLNQEWEKKIRRARGRRKVYQAEVLRVMEAVWEAANYPWSVRLREILRLWMPWIRSRFHLSKRQEERLLKMSSSTIDRHLKEKKRKLRRRIYGRTKPGALLRHQIPVRCEHWNQTLAGYLELDLVSHSGECATGDFLHTLNLTDLASGWVESRSVMGKGEKGVLDGLREMAQELPFKVLGIDSDNGSEFINWHLKSYCDSEDVQFTRSRPYKKDDNAHIEQKNWTHVRKLMGWDRYDSQEALEAMNDLYANELRLWMNLFQPCVKRLRTIRRGSHFRRVYDQPKTPLDRLLACSGAEHKKLLELQALRKRTDPFELAAKVQQKLERIWKSARYRWRPVEKMKQAPAQLQELSSAERKTLKDISQIFGIKVYVRTKKGGDLILVNHG